MKLNFCTLFDSNYLSRGLVMYQSLMNQDTDFQLYVFAFDNRCDRLLRKMNLPNLTVISLNEFEDQELLAVKSERTQTEYCWTCTSSTILFCLEKFKLKNCTYLDADMLFYQSPRVLIDEKPEIDHVIISAHRYTSYYDQSGKSGKYCVQFMYFDDTSGSMEVLKWWRERCLEWCYNRIEDGKFGDQKYLDDWTTRFDCVWEMVNPGGGLAPWNVQQYRFNDVSKGMEIRTGRSFTPVFYHFHGLKFYDNGKIIFKPNTYHLNRTTKNIFYQPYILKLHEAKKLINNFDATFDPHGSRPATSFFIDRFVKGKLSYMKSNFLNRFLN